MFVLYLYPTLLIKEVLGCLHTYFSLLGNNVHWVTLFETFFNILILFHLVQICRKKENSFSTSKSHFVIFLSIQKLLPNIFKNFNKYLYLQ